MRNIFIMLQKEFLQVMRSKQMLPMILLIPVIQLLILVHAATFEVKHINTFIIDNDYTTTSHKLIEKFGYTNNFIIINSSNSDKQAMDALARDKARLVIKIPNNFEKDLITGGSAKVQFIINAVDGSAAGVINSYCNNIVFNFNKNIVPELIALPANASLPPVINTLERFWYNQELDYKQYMVPGILSILITLSGMFLTGMNVVREKEIGTIEQINVTPIHKYQFIIGKLLPFWVIALFDLAFGLGLAELLFQTPIRGNIFLLFGMASTYLLVVLGLGLLISTITDTQQQSMFISWFFTVIFILMSGLFTPIDSMPKWAQYITMLNPLSYFIEIMRRVMLKGAGFAQVQKLFALLLVYGVAMLSLAVWRYKKAVN